MLPSFIVDVARCAEEDIMRNASMIGQALPAIEFPYSRVSCASYASMWPNYKERMHVISHDTRVELNLMLEQDAKMKMERRNVSE
jgi:hypothetical protein